MWLCNLAGAEGQQSCHFVCVCGLAGPEGHNSALPCVCVCVWYVCVLVARDQKWCVPHPEWWTKVEENLCSFSILMISELIRCHSLHMCSFLKISIGNCNTGFYILFSHSYHNNKGINMTCHSAALKLLQWIEMRVDNYSPNCMEDASSRQLPKQYTLAEKACILTLYKKEICISTYFVCFSRKKFLLIISTTHGATSITMNILCASW